jgi:hypothetical protein
MAKSIHTLAGIALLSGALLASISTPIPAAPKFESGVAADVTYDGLHRVDGAVMQKAWAKPDLDLSHYTKIMLLPAGMTFKDVDKHSSTQFPLSAKQKEALRETVLTVFTEELGKSKRFTLTNQPGADVLQVQAAILDVVSRVPPEPVGRGGFVLSSLGDAILVVELRDSLSEEILARAVDHRSVSPTFPRRSNSVNNLSEVRHAARSWASQMRRRLDEFTEL